MSRNKKKRYSDRRHQKRQPREETTEQTVGQSFRLTPTTKVLLFLAATLVYLVWFATTPLQSTEGWGPEGSPLTRLALWIGLFNSDHVLGPWFPVAAGHFGLFDRLPVLLVAAALLLFAYVPGRLLLEWLDVDGNLTRLERFIFAEAAGLNIVSLWTLLVGLIGGLHNELFFAAPAALVLALAGRRWQKEWFRIEEERSPSVQPSLGQKDDTPLRWVAGCLAIPFALIILWGSMMPPWEFDMREYHLQAPKEWYQQGQIDFLPHNVYANMPLGAEMHALLGMVVWQGPSDWWYGALVGKTITGCFTLLVGLGVFAAGKRWASSSAGALAALLFVSTPWVVQISTQGLNDVILAGYIFFAFYALMLSGRSEEEKPARRGAMFTLAGFLAGSAAACKYPGLLYAVLPLAIVILLRPRIDGWFSTPEASDRRSRRSTQTRNKAIAPLAWRSAALFLLAAASASGLWYAKNAILTGNPVYPLMVSTFGGETRTPEKDERWKRAHAVPIDDNGNRYTPESFVRSLATLGGRSEWSSPLLIPLALCSLLVVDSRRRSVVLLLLVGFIFFVWWTSTHRIERFLMPVYPLLALMAGLSLAWQSTRLWRHLLIGLLFWTSVANFLFSGSQVMGIDNRFFYSLDTLRYDLAGDEQESIVRVSPNHKKLNEIVPADRIVLLVGDAQPFDLEVPCLYNTCFDDCQFELLVADLSPVEQHARLQEAHISHIYVHWTELERYRSDGNYGYSDFVCPRVLYQMVVDGVLRPPLGKFCHNEDGSFDLSSSPDPQIFPVAVYLPRDTDVDPD